MTHHQLGQLPIPSINEAPALEDKVPCVGIVKPHLVHPALMRRGALCCCGALAKLKKWPSRRSCATVAGQHVTASLARSTGFCKKTPPSLASQEEAERLPSLGVRRKCLFMPVQATIKIMLQVKLIHIAHTHAWCCNSCHIHIQHQGLVLACGCCWWCPPPEDKGHVKLITPTPPGPFFSRVLPEVKRR